MPITRRCGLVAISQPYDCLPPAFAVCVQGITALLLGSSVIADDADSWPPHNHTIASPLLSLCVFRLSPCCCWVAQWWPTLLLLAITQLYHCLPPAFAVRVQGITVLLLGSSVVADFGGCWPRHNHTKVWAGAGGCVNVMCGAGVAGLPNLAFRRGRGRASIAARNCVIR